MQHPKKGPVLTSASDGRTYPAVRPVPHVAHNSGKIEWYTPAEYIEAARRTMGGIDLDPASSEIANRIVQAAHYYTIQDDGLVQPWFGRVWLNPPYSRRLVKLFTRRVADEYWMENIQAACVLVNNATETKWFQYMLSQAAAVCLLGGRVRFLDTDRKESRSPLQGQIVVYFGGSPTEFREHFRGLGQVCGLAT